MDSDDEDVSENDILDWYKNEVADIWDSATDSAFSDMSSNFSDMFRQIMNDVKQRNQPCHIPNGHGIEVNGHSSENSSTHHPPPNEIQTNMVSISSDQLMAMLQNDEEWFEETNPPDNEEMVLSVQLTDSTNQSEDDSKNVKGVSQEMNHHLADSSLWLAQPAS